MSGSGAARRVVEASAPCHLDLAGGPLDVWPAYLFHPGALAMCVAIDRRTSCRVETGVDGVEIESKDDLQKHRGRTLAELLNSGPAPAAALVLEALGVGTGVRVVTHQRVPDGTGLGATSALLVAITAATARATGRELTSDEVVRLCRDVEVRARALPAGVRGYYAAIRGGVVALELSAAGVSCERPIVDPARVEESLILVDARPSGEAGPPPAADRRGWEVVKGQIEGDGATSQALGEIAGIARRIRSALVGGCFEEAVALTAQEWQARRRLAAEATTPAIDCLIDVVLKAGGAAHAEGGALVVWAPPGARGAGRREAVLSALRLAGARLVPARVDLRGLAVEDAG